MITFWNRKEVYTGWDVAMRNQVIDGLVKKGIPYTTRQTSDMSSGRSRSRGVPGIRTDAQIQYYVYVHKKDYLRVQKLL